MLLIYTRLLCWDELQLSSNLERAASGPQDQEDSAQTEDETTSSGDRSWHVLTSTFDNAESANPRVDFLFTFLYGLFPINLMAFIRKPRKYLKAAYYPGADELDLKQDMIRARTEPHRQVHLMHPNFYMTTQEDELNENRWVKADAADIVTECLNLCLAVSSLKDPGPPPTGKLPPIPKSQPRKQSSILDMSPLVDDGASSPVESRRDNSWRDTQSTAATSMTANWSGEPLPAPPKSAASSSHGLGISSRGTSPSTKSRPSSPTRGLRQNPSHTSIATAEIPLHPLEEQKPALQSTASISSLPRMASFTQALSTVQFPIPPNHSSSASSKIASLQRENMLLRNDLNFERYLKQQHLSHIGQLQRKHIREATVEAETQNLLNTNRTLRSKLMKSNMQYEQLKKETTTSRSQWKKFEVDLTGKVRSYREEERQWQTEEDKLRAQCESLKKDCDNLRRLLVESEQREFNMSNQMQMRSADMEELDTLRKEVQNLRDKLHDFEQRELVFDQAEEDREALQTELEAFKMRTASKDAELDMTRRNLEIRIKDLESKLETSRPSSGIQTGQLPATVQQMLDSAVAASQARFNQLKKAHTRLLHKYTELEMKYSELDAGRDFEPAINHPFSAPSRGHDFDAPLSSSSHALNHSPSVTRRQRGFSDPPAPDTDDPALASNPATSPASGRFSREPSTRFESLSSRQQATERAREKESQMEGNLSGFLSYNPTKPLDVHHASGAKSNASLDSKGSDGRPKEKVKAQSEVRVYGRGRSKV